MRDVYGVGGGVSGMGVVMGVKKEEDEDSKDVKIPLPATEDSKPEKNSLELLDPSALPAPPALSSLLGTLDPSLSSLSLTKSRITPLQRAHSPSDTTHGGALPSLSERDITRMKEVMKADEEYEDVWAEMTLRMGGVNEQSGKPNWWERDVGMKEERRPGGNLQVVWPADGKGVREGRRGRAEIRM